MTNAQLNQIPDGFRDRCFQSAEKKRMMERLAEDVFSENGYSPVILPTLEYSHVFLKGLGEDYFPRLYHLFDHRGRLLALRADPTCSISRLVASKFNGLSFPLRLFYIAPVFRRGEPYAGKLNEFTQAGAELIGSEVLEADLEIVSLALKILRSLGLSGYQLNLSHAGLLEGIFSGMKADPESRHVLWTLLGERDRVGLEKALAGISMTPEERAFLAELPGMVGKEDLLERAVSLVSNGLALEAVSYLKRILKKLGSDGSDLVFDLGLVRKFDYYTGLIFEIYVQKSGFPIGGGGRYDRMLAKFGRDLPAVGFSFTLDRLEEIL